MAEGSVHTVYSDGRWKNKIEGAAPPPGWYDRREIAAEAGRAHAMRRHAEHVIRNEDGTIAQRVSYVRDRVFGAPQAAVEDRTGLAYAMAVFWNICFTTETAKSPSDRYTGATQPVGSVGRRLWAAPARVCQVGEGATASSIDAIPRSGDDGERVRPPGSRQRAMAQARSRR